MDDNRLLTSFDVNVPFKNENGTEKVFVLGITLKRLLEKKGVTQTEVSIDLGIPHSTLNDWIHYSAPRMDSLPNILRMADYFGVSFYYLCFGERSDQEAMQEKIQELTVKLEKAEWLIEKQQDMFKTKSV
jgi:transcriptional regulator with XRE-family HTH domain